MRGCALSEPDVFFVVLLFALFSTLPSCLGLCRTAWDALAASWARLACRASSRAAAFFAFALLFDPAFFEPCLFLTQLGSFKRAWCAGLAPRAMGFLLFCLDPPSLYIANLALTSSPLQEMSPQTLLQPPFPLLSWFVSLGRRGSSARDQARSREVESKERALSSVQQGKERGLDPEVG